MTKINAEMIKNAKQQLDTLSCQYAFYFSSPGQEPVLLKNCDRFLSASIIKVPILLAWLRLEQQSQVNRAELCNLDSVPQVQGAGFSWLLRGRMLPYQDVLMLMIALSDNLSTNLIIERIGLHKLANTIQDDLGLTGAELQRKLMDYEARSRGLDNWITAADCIRLFELIEALPEADRSLAEDMLAVNQDDLLLRRNIPRDTLDFYHKTGSISNVLHDWGYTKDCRIFLLTQKVKAEPAAFEVFGQLGKWMIT